MGIKRLLKPALLFANKTIDVFLYPIVSFFYKHEIVLVDLSLIGDVLVALPYYYLIKDTVESNKLNVRMVCLKRTEPIFNIIFGKSKLGSIGEYYYYGKYNPLMRYKLPMYPDICFISHTNVLPYMLELADLLYPKKVYYYEGEFDDANFDLGNNYRGNCYIIKRKTVSYHIWAHIKILFENIISLLGGDLENFSVAHRGSYERLLLESKIDASIGASIMPKDYVVFLPETTALYRALSYDKLLEILKFLSINFGQVVVLSKNRYKFDLPNTLNLSGKTSLLEAMYIISNARLVVGHETGLVHFSYLYGIPTICILGGGHYGRFVPWPENIPNLYVISKSMSCFRCNWRCKFVNLEEKRPPCLENISSDEVIEAIRDFLSNKKEGI